MKDVGERDPAERGWEAVRRHLDALKRPIVDEIRNYPPPVAGCDQHYGLLLEKRDAIVRELGRLAQAEAAATGAGAGGDAATVEAFVETSPVIDADAAREIRESLNA